MLSIHYVSIMMRIFYMDYQQHRECGFSIWITNSTGNADFLYGLPTAPGMLPNHEYWCECPWQSPNEWYQQNSHKWQTWQWGFQWHRTGIELVFKSLDCFTMRLFHSATVFFVLLIYLLFETSLGWLPGWRVFISFTFCMCVCILCVCMGAGMGVKYLIKYI